MAAVIRRLSNLGGWKRGDRKSRRVTSVSFSVITLTRNGRVSWKACENLPDVRMRFYVKLIHEEKLV